MKRKAQDLLLKYKLRKTSCRVSVLELLMLHNHALAHADLEKQLGTDYDRVTLYRTLYAFKEQGLVHSITDLNGVMKYALCREACSHLEHQHDHIHFSCCKCGQTYCLDEVRLGPVVLPDGYLVSDVQFSVQGICKLCNTQSLEVESRHEPLMH
ncbi:Fur family ferric uptake transcriptional regulator [Pontibacter aydingkolensis]|uniref:Transcriptional repressor n=1 Tax=Pontibacter aydingkolensis TaxID=1911536 RepID=A0ABS7CPW1_9BACT|nr:transcriptional repressor [Pontibacter aydingkolensis]MBW7465881.1 transcriptional repressor [Pontibacter aydingkolensis]